MFGEGDLARCYACGDLQLLSAFPQDRSKARGIKSICRRCDNHKASRYYAQNRDRVKARVKAHVAAARPPKKCKKCGVELRNRRFTYCRRCREARERAGAARPRRHNERTSQRGYGWEHQKARKRFAQLVAAGLAKCARCGEPIAPNEPWDLGHDDLDRSQYSGPEHRRCNRATAGRHKPRSSRTW